MANEVFISYSRSDYQKVRKIKETIDREVGIECWMDLDGIESDQQFVDVIINVINKYDTVLFMMSQSSMQSKWALDELAFAEKKHKRIVLVRLDKAEMPDRFYFLYHSKDQIEWSNVEQRKKLIKNLQSWFHQKLQTENFVDEDNRHTIIEMKEDNQKSSLLRKFKLFLIADFLLSIFWSVTAQVGHKEPELAKVMFISVNCLAIYAYVKMLFPSHYVKVLLAAHVLYFIPSIFWFGHDNAYMVYYYVKYVYMILGVLFLIGVLFHYLKMKTEGKVCKPSDYWIRILLLFLPNILLYIFQPVY